MSDSDYTQDASEDELEEDDEPHINLLQQPNTFSISAKVLYEKVKKGRIDLDADYQRQKVWTDQRQIGLIDSIFQNRFVMSLLFNIERKGAKSEIWLCMDGKQRITSIVRFMDGEIPWIDPVTNKKFFFRHLDGVTVPRGGSKKRIMSESMQETFADKLLTTTLYKGLSDAEQRDIFKCVQEGVPLSMGEKMRASSGPWADLGHVVAKRYFTGKDGNGWSGRIIKSSRGSELTVIAAVLRLVKDVVASRAVGYVGAAKLREDFSLAEPPPQDVITRLYQICDRIMQVSLVPPTVQLASIFNTQQDESKHSQRRVKQVKVEGGSEDGVRPTHQAFFSPIISGSGSFVSPVEFIWIVYLFHLVMDTTSDGVLLEMIEMIKKDVRKKHPGQVRNGRVCAEYLKAWAQDAQNSRFSGKYEKAANASPPKAAPPKAAPPTAKPKEKVNAKALKRSMSSSSLSSNSSSIIYIPPDKAPPPNNKPRTGRNSTASQLNAFDIPPQDVKPDIHALNGTASGSRTGDGGAQAPARRKLQPPPKKRAIGDESVVKASTSDVGSATTGASGSGSGSARATPQVRKPIGTLFRWAA